MHCGVSIESPWYSAWIDTNDRGLEEKEFSSYFPTSSRVRPSASVFLFSLAFTGGFCITAPAHQHAIWVAVYPALFLLLVRTYPRIKEE